MHCRSVLLLEQEVFELAANPLWGIRLHRIPEQPLICFANISGLKDSLWEKGSFHITLIFSEHYNEIPPEVVFNTIPFHPNVHPQSGKVTINFLNKSQKKVECEIKLANLLISIQELLSNPILDEAVNIEAKKLLQESPHDYEGMVHQCVAESRRLYSAMNKAVMENYLHVLPKNSLKTAVRVIRESPKGSSTLNPIIPFKPKQVSFDVYHRAWSEAATTKAISACRLTSDDEDQATLKEWHPNYPAIRSFSPSSSVRIGSRSLKPSDNNNLVSKGDIARKKKIEKLEALKQMYLNKANNHEDLPLSPSVVKTYSTLTGQSSVDKWDAEADELVAWTDALNTEKMLASY